jgi:large conductance mechanosensitive channel
MEKKEQKKKKFKKGWEDFKSFALKDNVISMAIGVVIGAAFKDLINSLVNNVFTPPIGFLTAKLDFSKLFITLGKTQYETLEEAKAANAVVIQYGLVLNTLIAFLITAFVLYLVSKAVSKATQKEKEAKIAKKTKKCPYCMSEINIKAKRCPFCTSELRK